MTLTQCKFFIQIVHWMCSNFNDSESLRYKNNFYCIPPGILETVMQKSNLDSFREVPIVSYVGLDLQFGDDSIFFDKIAASMRKLVREPNNERLKIHAYAGRIIEDMAKVTIPAYEHMKDGLPRFYLAYQDKITGHWDSGVFIIKFMQFWGLDKPLQHWDKVKLNIL
ncbi:hypothetical protein AHAS_Ahas04G0057700 [Arachis hypogaea]